MADSREIAVTILCQMFSERRFLDFTSAETLSDRGFVKMLVLTAVRRYEFLRRAISQFASKKLPAKETIAQYALIAGAAELLFMNTPDYAVINSYVNLVKRRGNPHLSGFVNAVLRKIATEKETLLKHDKGEFFTAPFFELLNRDYSKNQIRSIQASALKEPPLVISVKTNPAGWAEKLSGKVIGENSVVIFEAGKVENLPGYAKGEWWVQDYAASLAVSALAPKKGLKVLDLCAAPGGKTAQLLNAGAEVTSLDSSQTRLNTLRQNMERLRFHPAQIICADALLYLEEFNGEPFDAILLDAPCSGTGIFRRHPEIPHIKNFMDADRQALIQKQILERISPVLKPGGELIYCTCSIAKAEGEEQIRAFLAAHPEFITVPLDRFNAEFVTPEGWLRTLPCHLPEFGGCDAFFIARLHKKD